MDKFYQTMNEIREEIFEKMNISKNKVISPEAEEDFNKSIKCYIYGGSFNNIKAKRKIWNHCHFAGLY